MSCNYCRKKMQIPNYNNKSSFFLLILLMALCYASSATNNNNNSGIKCKDESGRDVDWFIAYKLPKTVSSYNPHIKEGVGYAYLLPGSEGWIESLNEIGDEGSMMGMSLKDLYDKDYEGNLTYVLYNDQPPVGPQDPRGGHTKGVVLTTPSGGIWLQHSVPHYPSLEGNYSYPHTGRTNGQVLHCMSLSAPQLDTVVGDMLKITKAHVYASNLAEGVDQNFPKMSSFLKGPRPTVSSPVSDDPKIFQFQNGQRYIYSFAKAPEVDKEIYSDWIAPKFKSELNVQSWLNGRGAFPSNCTSPLNKVYNVEDSCILNVGFTTHKDHSKWGIAVNKSVVCIGDLNRMEEQTHRGGSVNCFMDKGVWKAFEKIVKSTQPCGKPSNGNVTHQYYTIT